MIKLSEIISSLKRNPKARDIRNYCFQLLADINSYEDEYEVVNAYTGKQKNRKNGERHPVLFRNFAKAFKNEDLEMLTYYITECISANSELIIREIAASNAKSIGMLGEALEDQFDKLNNNLERLIHILDPNHTTQDPNQAAQNPNHAAQADPNTSNDLIVADNLDLSVTPTISKPLGQSLAPQSEKNEESGDATKQEETDSIEKTVVTSFAAASASKAASDTEDEDDDEEYDEEYDDDDEDDDDDDDEDDDDDDEDDDDEDDEDDDDDDDDDDEDDDDDDDEDDDDEDDDDDDDEDDEDEDEDDEDDAPPHRRK